MVDFDRLARFYDYEYGQLDADVPMYLGFADRVGGPILELGCGTGRLVVALAAAGFHVTGVDVSRAMLDIARRKAQDAGVADQVHLVQASMEHIALHQPFHMALCALNSFMLLGDLEAQLRALRCWHRHLRPGGLLIIDLFPPHPARLAEEDGRLILQYVWEDVEEGLTILKHHVRRVDFAEQKVYVHYLYDEVAPDGTLRRTVAPFVMRYLGRFEMELLLEKAGYTVEAIYGSWELDPFESESDRMIFVAHRRGRE
ncbi:MAG TPA: class I SAM-dependent methyltransferase [Caldilineae bacterium]|nr:class I SAM-dependent methyltransferase [Caldilineae bacterium]